jgi:hypothetical protein
MGFGSATPWRLTHRRVCHHVLQGYVAGRESSGGTVKTPASAGPKVVLGLFILILTSVGNAGAATINLSLSIDLGSALRVPLDDGRISLGASATDPPASFTVTNGDTVIVDFDFIGGNLRIQGGDAPCMVFSQNRADCVELVFSFPLVSDEGTEIISSATLELFGVSGTLTENPATSVGGYSCFDCLIVGGTYDLLGSDFSFTGGSMSSIMLFSQLSLALDFGGSALLEVKAPDVTVVPEPSTALLLAAGLTALAVRRRGA